MLIGRDPVKGEALASQPTLSRFENSVDRKDIYRMGEALADVVIERHRDRLHGRARRITIDLDPTDDPTHGAQQLSFFNGYYDSWCYLLVVGLSRTASRNFIMVSRSIAPVTVGSGPINCASCSPPLPMSSSRRSDCELPGPPAPERRYGLSGNDCSRSAL